MRCSCDSSSASTACLQPVVRDVHVVAAAAVHVLCIAAVADVFGASYLLLLLLLLAMPTATRCTRTLRQS
jgi:hypothetical protein